MNLENLKEVNELDETLKSINNRIEHAARKEFRIESNSGSVTLAHWDDRNGTGFFNEQEKEIVAMLTVAALKRKRDAVIDRLYELGVDVEI